MPSMYKSLYFTSSSSVGLLILGTGMGLPMMFVKQHGLGGPTQLYDDDDGDDDYRNDDSNNKNIIGDNIIYK